MVQTFIEKHDKKKRPRKPKATIVEFVGPPGGGKTTSSLYFSDLLKAKSFKVCLSHDLKAYIRNLSWLKKMALYSGTLFSNTYTLLSFTKALARHKIFSINSIYRYLRLSIFEQGLKQMVKSQKIDYVLLDQWLIQELWSATIFRTEALHNLKPALKEFYFKTDHVFYFDIDAETAAERIENRNTNMSRFDRMPSEKRLSELKKYNGYLYQLYENSDCPKKHVFSTKQSLEQNSELFLQLLEPALPSQS